MHCLQVLGVAIVVPNAFYPYAFDSPGLVACAVLMIGVLTTILKIGLFDFEPADTSDHAVHQSALSAYAYLTVYPATNIGLCASGGAAAILIPAIGAGGLASHTQFAQTVLCGSTALTWCSLALTALIHRPLGNKRQHARKVAARLIGGGALLPLAFFRLPDFWVLAFVVASNLGVVATLKLMTRGKTPWGAASGRRSNIRSSFVGGDGDAWSSSVSLSGEGQFWRLE